MNEIPLRSDGIATLVMRALEYLIKQSKGATRLRLLDFDSRPKLNSLLASSRAEHVFELRLVGGNRILFAVMSSAEDLERFAKMCLNSDTFIPALVVDGTEHVKLLAHRISNGLKRAFKYFKRRRHEHREERHEQRRSRPDIRHTLFHQPHFGCN